MLNTVQEGSVENSSKGAEQSKAPERQCRVQLQRGTVKSSVPESKVPQDSSAEAQCLRKAVLSIVPQRHREA